MGVRGQLGESWSAFLQAFRSGEVPHGLRPDQVEAALKRLVASPAS